MDECIKKLIDDSAKSLVVSLSHMEETYYIEEYVSDYSNIAAESFFLEKCDSSIKNFRKKLEERSNNLPLWVTHPSLYNDLRCYIVELRKELYANSINIIDNTSILVETFEDRTGMTSIWGKYMESYNDLILDEDKLFVWRMSN